MPDIKVRVTGADESAPAFESVSDALKDLEEQTKKTASGFTLIGEAVAKGTHEVERGMNMLTRLDLVQITLGQQTDRLSEAQERYNEVVAKFGPSSQESEKAAKDLTTANEELHKAQLRAEMSMGLVIAQSVTMATSAIPAGITALRSFAAAQTAAAVAAGALQATLSFGAAAIGITAGVIAVTQAIEGLGTAERAATQDTATLTRQLNEQQMTMMRLAAGNRTFGEVMGDIWAGLTGGEFSEEIAREKLHAIQRMLTAAYAQIARDSANVTKTLADQVAQVNADAARSAEEAAKRTQGAWAQSLATVGVNLETLSESALRELDAIGGKAGVLAAALLALRDEAVLEFEKKLGEVSAETREELLKQAAAVKDKSGEHAILNRVLKDGVISEEEHRRASQETTQALNDQAAAGRGVSAAMAEMYASGNNAKRRSNGDYTVARDPNFAGSQGSAVSDALDLYFQRNPDALADPQAQFARRLAEAVAQGRPGVGAGLGDVRVIEYMRDRGIGRETGTQLRSSSVVVNQNFYGPTDAGEVQRATQQGMSIAELRASSQRSF